MLSIKQEQNELKELITAALSHAKVLGASSAEVGANISSGFNASVRMGEVDTLEYQRDKAMGITVYFGQCKGSASTSDLRFESVNQAVKAACDIAKFTTGDPCNGLASKDLMAFDYPDLDLYHPWDITPQQAIEIAKSSEAIALSYDPRIINSEGVSISTQQGTNAYGNSNDFLGIFPSSQHSCSCIFVAKENSHMQRDYDYTVARDKVDLKSFGDVALSAAQRTIARLNAKQVKTQKAPVVFRADIAKKIFGSFISAISGRNLYREASFLLDSLGKQLFADSITISEHPHIKKALGSAPFDQEGMRTPEREIVANGSLVGYVLGSYSARKLGMKPTANGVHNLCVSNKKDVSLDALFKQMGTGLFVTETIGHGTNIVTGDYSLGAAGFWIENGEIAYPVEEITIASNLKDMFANIIDIANDVDVRGNIRTGSILIAEMTIAGE